MRLPAQVTVNCSSATKQCEQWQRCLDTCCPQPPRCEVTPILPLRLHCPRLQKKGSWYSFVNTPGSMGIVSPDQDVKLGRSVAVKFLPPRWVSEQPRSRLVLEGPDRTKSNPVAA